MVQVWFGGGKGLVVFWVFLMFIFSCLSSSTLFHFVNDLKIVVFLTLRRLIEMFLCAN